MTDDALPLHAQRTEGGQRLSPTQLIVGGAVLLTIAAIASLSLGPTGITAARVRRVKAR